MSNYISANEVAIILNVNVQTVYRLVWARKIPFTKIGRVTRFSADEINEWLKAVSFKPKDGGK